MLYKNVTEIFDITICAFARGGKIYSSYTKLKYNASYKNHFFVPGSNQVLRYQFHVRGFHSIVRAANHCSIHIVFIYTKEMTSGREEAKYVYDCTGRQNS